MASKIDFTSALQERVPLTLNQLQGYKWVITREELADDILNIDLNESNLGVYQKYAKTISPQTDVLTVIQKIAKKIESCKQVIQYIQSDSQKLDPRVCRIQEKLKQFNNLEKIEKYTLFLQNLKRQSSNQITITATGEILKKLKEIRIEMLKKQHEFRVCNFSDDAIQDQYYDNDTNSSLYLTEGKKQASARFMVEMLNPNSHDKIKFCDERRIENIITTSHDKCSLSHSNELKNPDPFDAFAQKQHHDLWPLALEQDQCVLPPKMSFERLESSINALLASKHKHKLSNICGLIRFNDSHLVLAIDKENIIYLFNQYGNEESQFNPFIMAFGNVDQATKSLLHVLNNSPTPIQGAISLAAVCDPREYHEMNYLIDDAEGPPYVEPDDEFHDEFHMVHHHIDDGKGPPYINSTEIPRPPTLEAECPPVFHLQQMVETLSLFTDEGYDQALTISTHLNAPRNKFDSPINDDKDKDALDRIFFHLYHVQNKDRPSAINRNDPHWGSLAFQSDLSTPAEKLRAVQRTQTEIILFILSRITVDMRNNRPVSLFLEALEKLQMHPNDLPKGETNPAYSIFGNLYSIYLAAWEQNKEMVHPHDPRFNGDFGRNAFLDPHFASKFKEQAVQEFILSLKKAWSL